MEEHAKKRRKRYLVISIVPLLLIMMIGWIGFNGLRAKRHLGVAAQLVSQLQRDIQQGDATGAQATLTRLRTEIRDARDATDGVAWSVASSTPKLGDDLAAVQDVAGALDDLANKGLPALVDVAAGMESALLSPKDGRIDLAALQRSTPKLADGTTAIRAARKRVARIRTAGLDPRIKAPVQKLQSGLSRAESMLAPAERSARLLPPMLGAGGPRTYLVLFQNLAEVRATGGMPGAFVELEANNGAIRIVNQGSATVTLRTFDSPVVPLDPDLEELHSDRLARYPADVNLTPDFPTAATTIREMYRQRTGRTVDGVMATDPVALSYLLKATGPVQLPVGGSLTAANAVKRLLSDSYAEFPDPGKQDAFFAGAAQAVFAALIAHSANHMANPTSMFEAVRQAASERRLLLWSSHAEEESDIAGTVLGGVLPADDGANPTVGVFLNDGSGAKLSYYLTHSVELTTGDCLEDKAVELRLKVTLGSKVPPSGLPAYVLGLGLAGDPYTVRTNLMVYSPSGGGIVETAVDGKAYEDGGFGVEKARSVAVVTVDLKPGEVRTVEMTVITGPIPDTASVVSPQLRLTPGVQPWPATVHTRQSCRKK
jgi:hypothetical protein